MRPPTVRLTFQDGTMVDTNFSSWFYVENEGRFKMVQTIHVGDTLLLRSVTGPRTAVLVAINSIRTKEKVCGD